VLNSLSVEKVYSPQTWLIFYVSRLERITDRAFFLPREELELKKLMGFSIFVLLGLSLSKRCAYLYLKKK